MNEPSPQLDAAICDLIAAIAAFSDPDFDSFWLNLSEPELELLTLSLLQHWTANLNGKLLAALLMTIRSPQ